LYYPYRGVLEFTNGKIYIKSLKAYEDSELDVKYKEIDIQDLCQRITNVSIKLKIIKNHTYMIYLYCIINKIFDFYLSYLIKRLVLEKH